MWLPVLLEDSGSARLSSWHPNYPEARKTAWIAPLACDLQHHPKSELGDPVNKMIETFI